MNLDDMIVTAFRAECLNKATALEAEYDRMVAEEKATIKDATRAKSAMPANYWHERHRVGEMARAARRLAEIFR